MSCLFCKIARAEIETAPLYENEHVVAFRDIHPQAPQHILIIPRRHIATLNELDADSAYLVGEMLLAAKKLAAQMGFAEEGFRTVMNCNDDGGQTVYHLHLHLLGGRRMGWPPG